MRQSALYAPTLREDPKEAEVTSHRLLLRGGYVRQVASGVYAYLPLAHRVLRKIARIIEEEMDRAGAQELLLPVIQPKEVWDASGRWETFGPLMFRAEDRHGRPFALGPTHEELITALVRDEVRSYKRLPLRLYQIQTKFRDEYRPRFGLLRGREFLMKDAYSFDRDEEGLEASYWAMYRAYERIFRRLGVEARAVLADTGAMGGSESHEFMILADVGEDTIAYCPRCDYAANVERAEVVFREEGPPEEPMEPLRRARTPGARTVAEQAAALGLPPEKIIKNVVYVADGEVVVVLVRGDHEANEAKVRRLLRAETLEMADEDTIRRTFGAGPGFVGPVGVVGVRFFADHAVRTLRNASTGANRDDEHFLGVNPGRDFEPEGYYDLRTVQEGDVCPKCGAPLRFARGIEVGHVFKLGTKYSEALGATYLDEEGRERPIVMGSYGIGVSRLVQAIVEQSHDEDGIIWPLSVAPYEVHLLVTNVAEPELREAGERLYEELTRRGVEVLYDDRPDRAGVKFKDADLLGIPYHVVVGARTREGGVVEWKERRTRAVEPIPLAEAAEAIATRVAEARRAFSA
ncbi:MAG: Prolyl-tRNA synthetase [Brockia lithotrophica]|uniref:Proline--tRNA ligase n=1 Tax=Brockia lithotrophica TaxID=933949 RepID=A0A2T5G8X7_9BACL|nr:MAG: Prolyl-tRNA synthetase [Brockia lithotrophica]